VAVGAAHEKQVLGFRFQVSGFRKCYVCKEVLYQIPKKEIKIFGSLVKFLEKINPPSAKEDLR
jgi:hypothetical protein